jgi:hypothetical protein
LNNIREYARYRDPLVRALVWSLVSPPLVSSAEYPASLNDKWCQAVYQSLAEELMQLDQSPEPLQLWVAKQKSWRLGIRFESFWSFIFTRLLARREILDWTSHVQIFDKQSTAARPNKSNNTLGELDFVYRDNQQQFHHLEVAVKFYLLKPDQTGHRHLIGPNGADWYERKLEHLFQKQLPLSALADSRAIIAERFSVNPNQLSCRQQGIIKGMLFYPAHLTGDLTKEEKNSINPECLHGDWITLEHWQQIESTEECRWVIIEKLSWLCPQVFQALTDACLTNKEMHLKLKLHFNNTRRSILVARLNFDAESGLWLEQQRIMVVDTIWPEYLSVEQKQLS